MAYYKPCKNCAVDKAACARRAEIAEAITGLHVTVVNFRCADRRPFFTSGQRVAFNWTSWENDDEYHDDNGLGLIYHGTVVAEHGLRFIVRVDDAPSADAERVGARDTFKSDNLVIKVKPSDMKALNEPARRLCPSCSAYEGEAGRCQGWDDGPYGYWPDGCFVQADKSASAKATAHEEAVF